ncbi:MAG: hypothetical protein F4X47_00155 [Gammaproteobacteria bacterium]|nr:hypothetical protein [Gammaproteobacteria bacterium]MYC50709.1 hypothetical protein [Gammaproteobacteria bacterium]
MSDSKLLDRARDELFSHINRCGVVDASEADQSEWMNDTIDYLAERYPTLAAHELRFLHAVGMRFCQPAIARGAATITTGANSDTPAGQE